MFHKFVRLAIFHKVIAFRCFYLFHFLFLLLLFLRASKSALVIFVRGGAIPANFFCFSEYFENGMLFTFLFTFRFFLWFAVVSHYLLFIFFIAVLAACLNAFAVGAPLDPGFLIFSPDPLAILFLLACMFAYNPFGILTTNS